MANKFPLLAALLLFSLATPLLRASDLDDARARFNDREFEKSAALFEKASQTQPSAGVFFELGRAYAELGNNAQAALSFRRSLLLDPRFAPARTALRESETKLGIPQPKALWQTRLSEWIPLDPLVLVATLLFWAGAFIVLVSIFFRAGKIRTASGILALVLAIVLLTAAWFVDSRVIHRDTAMVLTPGGTTALSSPAEQSDKIASLPEGSLINIRSQRGRWFFATLPNGSSGWLLTEGIVPIVPSA